MFLFNEFSNNKRSITKLFIFIVLFVLGSYFVYKWTVNNEYLLLRYEKTIEGDSSQRDVIYSNAWNLWYHSENFSNTLFGYGFDATINNPAMGGSRAHNDWLEILVDYGLIGALLYLLVFISFVVQITKTKSKVTRLVLYSSLSIWFLKSLYSMGFSEGNMYLLMISLGASIGRSKKMLNR